METAWQFLQTYWPLLALGGVVAFLVARTGGAGCCGGGQGASCHRDAASTAAGASAPATPAELRQRLSALRAEQDALARRIEALEGEAPEQVAIGVGQTGGQGARGEST